MCFSKEGDHVRYGTIILCALLICLAAPQPTGTAIAADGKARVVIVVADQPLPVAQYAAEELACHIEKATGARPQIATEKDIPPEPPGRIYVGDCEAARKAGIEAEKLPPEACVLKTSGDSLFIVGEDGDGDPLAVTTHAGTLWGVYEFLEKTLHVRWLWPGELGVYVPKTAAVKIPDFDETISPRLFQRNIRPGLSLRGADKEYAFSPEALKKYRHNQQVFLRRHRMGRSMHIRYGHAFNAWWDKYGRDHPEWFQLLEDGRRGPATPRSRFSMCVSNPGFHRRIVELWKEAREKNPGEFININCCENDIRGLCTCPRCLSWDGPQPATIPERFGPRVVSDRYARFYLTVQQLAAEEDPEATVVGYAYVNYYPAPVTGIKLNEHVIVGLVPDLFFPRSSEEQDWVKQQWAGWQKTGARLFLRPNYMLQGYCMPHVFAHQFADEFLFCAHNGMAAMDFDSLTGQWATQGPTLYLLVRLHLHPDKTADELLAEYYDAFGPAADYVKAYFDYWEKYVSDNCERFEEIAEERRAGWSSYAKMADALFPPESFAPAEKILNNAAKAAADAPESTARVDFLRKGLEHAKLCARVCALVAGDDEDISPVALGHARDELLAFRRATEHDGISNLNFCAFVEGRSWRLPNIYTGEPVKPVCGTPAKLEGPPVIPTRGTHTLVALLKAGERFKAVVLCKRVARYTDEVKWRLFGPDDKLLDKGSIPPDEKADLDIAARQEGVHLLEVRSGHNAAFVTSLNDHAVLAGRTIHLIGASSPLFFYVPKGTSKFTLTLWSPAPGETAKVRIFDPEGKEVAAGCTGKKDTYTAGIAVPPAQSGRAWSAATEKAETGVLEDYTLTVSDNLPPYWSHAGDRLLIPMKSQ